MKTEERAAVRVLIVDDEPQGRRFVQALLADDDEIEIVGEAVSAEQGREQIFAARPDLVFMDIEMPGESGIDMLRALPEPLPYVIFLTAHENFALPAFELHAFDYLVKPAKRERFMASVIRAKQRIAEQRIAGLAAQIAAAANSLRGAPPAQNGHFPRHLTVRVRRKLVSLKIDDIAWIEGASQYSKIHTHNSEFLLSRSLASLESELDPMRFFRIHRSAIVNAAHVREVRSNGDGRYSIHLQRGPALPLSRTRKDVLQALLSELPSQA